KVDRKALPVPERGKGARAYVEPRTATEKVLAEIWAKVLKLERVGVEDNFFELGGHSLLGALLVSKIREMLEIDLPIRCLFEEPSVSGLSAQIDKFGKSAASAAAPKLERVERGGKAVMSYAQERLWFLDQLSPGSAAYNIPGAVRLKGQLEVG